MDRQTLLQHLPPEINLWEVVKEDQGVPDIIKQVVRAHKANEQYYDLIALYFDAPTVLGICENIDSFLTDNIDYKEETIEAQTTAVPQGILARGYGDCKHYASMAGGILAALQRLTDKKFSWYYCFASYRLWEPMPYHVFVIVETGGRQYWIDPTPGAEGKTPVWMDNRKIKTGMPLYNQIAGIGTVPDAQVQADFATDIPADLVGPINILQRYGVLSPLGEFNQARYSWLNMTAGDPVKQTVTAAVQSVLNQTATVGNFFDDAFKAVQHFAAGMGMQVPRATFLGLVSQNVFGYATKLHKALQYTDTKNKLSDLWERLGGTFSKLEDTINSGATKKAVLNGFRVGEIATAASIIGSAAIIIAAIMPVITKMMAAHGENINADIPLNPTTGQPLDMGSGNSIMNFISTNPIPVAIGAALILYYVYENS